MREILFRGKRIDNGEWVNGCYLSHLEKQPSPIKMDFDKDIQPKCYILQDGFADWNMPKPIYQYEVIPETVGQYTGLCDKNGTKIFERDIVVWDNGEGRIVKPFEVAFDSNYGYMFCARKKYHDNSMSDILDINFIDIDKKSIEVIGNIYDNKKLIEEQDK